MLLLANCQEDLYDNITPAADGQATHRILTGPEALEQKQKLVEVLKANGGEGAAMLRSTFTGAATARYTWDEIEAYIDYTEVYELQDKYGNTNYTLRVNHPDADEHSFFNIVRKTRNQKSKAVLIQYKMQPGYAADYARTGDIINFTGTMNFTVLSADNGVKCPEEPDPPVPVQGGQGPGHEQGGGGTGGSVSWGGDYPTVYDPGSNVDANQQLVAVQHAYLNFIAASAPEPEEWVYVSKSPRYFRVPPMSLSDGTSPCGDGQEIGILDPFGQRNHTKNCEKLKAMVQNTNIQDALSDLKNQIYDFENEHGYILKQEANYDTCIELPEGDEDFISMQVGGNVFGTMHTHQHDGKSIPMFSAEDIFAFFKLIHHFNYSGQNVQAMMPKFVTTVTTAQGTYALKVDGNFHAVMASIVNNPEKKQDFITILKNRQQKKDADNSDFRHQKDLLYIINKYELGISLYKLNEDTSNWDKLSLDVNSPNGVKMENCK